MTLTLDTPSAPPAQPLDGAAPAPPVLVRVLGPVQVDGAARPFTRASALDLVVYLALHPRGTTTAQWATALWPERAMAPATVHSTSSAARRSLGADADGVDHLPHRHGRLVLGPMVGTDLDVVEVALQRGDLELQRAALRYLRGRPFDGLRREEWVIGEGHQARAEAAVANLVGTFAGALLRAGDALGALDALRRGIEACPYDEALWRLRLLATQRTGSQLGLDQVMAELAAVLQLPSWRGSEGPQAVRATVHPATWATYERLRQSQPAPGGGGGTD